MFRFAWICEVFNSNTPRLAEKVDAKVFRNVWKKLCGKVFPRLFFHCLTLTGLKTNIVASHRRGNQPLWISKVTLRRKNCVRKVLCDLRKRNADKFPAGIPKINWSLKTSILPQPKIKTELITFNYFARDKLAKKIIFVYFFFGIFLLILFTILSWAQRWKLND